MWSYYFSRFTKHKRRLKQKGIVKVKVFLHYIDRTISEPWMSCAQEGYTWGATNYEKRPTTPSVFAGKFKTLSEAIEVLAFAPEITAYDIIVDESKLIGDAKKEYDVFKLHD
jgi:hypothetical protein